MWRIDSPEEVLRDLRARLVLTFCSRDVKGAVDGCFRRSPTLEHSCTSDLLQLLVTWSGVVFNCMCLLHLSHTTHILPSMASTSGGAVLIVVKFLRWSPWQQGHLEDCSTSLHRHLAQAYFPHVISSTGLQRIPLHMAHWSSVGDMTMDTAECHVFKSEWRQSESLNVFDHIPGTITGWPARGYFYLFRPTTPMKENVVCALWWAGAAGLHVTYLTVNSVSCILGNNYCLISLLVFSCPAGLRPPPRTDYYWIINDTSVFAG